MLSEIGSNFWEYSIDSSVSIPNFFWSEAGYHVEYYKSGRNAIKALCKSIQIKNKTVFLPMYTCETVIQPFVDEGWNIKFYRINRDFSIDIKNLNELLLHDTPDLIYVHSYYGFDTITNDTGLLWCKNNGIKIVEDVTQSLFSNHHISYADYFVTSFRKFFAIPDGGALISRNELNAGEICECDDRISKIALNAYQLKSEYMENPDPNIKEKFREKYQELFEIIGYNEELTRMSPLSIEILNTYDVADMIGKRRENYQFLRRNLQMINDLQIIIDKECDQSTPLYFPVYVDNRNELQQYLSEKNIYCPVIWPKSKLISSDDEESTYIYDHILCIPIDQRYGTEEMERIVAVITHYFGDKTNEKNNDPWRWRKPITSHPGREK